MYNILGQYLLPTSLIMLFGGNIVCGHQPSPSLCYYSFGFSDPSTNMIILYLPPIVSFKSFIFDLKLVYVVYCSVDTI